MNNYYAIAHTHSNRDKQAANSQLKATITEKQ